MYACHVRPELSTSSAMFGAFTGQELGWQSLVIPNVLPPARAR
jgi:hypothetical protein